MEDNNFPQHKIIQCSQGTRLTVYVICALLFPNILFGRSWVRIRLSTLKNCLPQEILLPIFHSCPPNVCITLTIVEPGLKVRIWPVLHEYALCQIGVHYDLRSHGADRVHQFAGNLVFLPVSVWQVVVAVAGVKVEAIVLSRWIVNAVTGRQGTKYFNL